jgi:hypothetical protein
MKHSFSAVVLLTICSALAWTQQNTSIAANPVLSLPASAAAAEPQPGEVPDTETQNDYAAQVLNLINAAGEIHAGRGNQLVEFIENSLPAYLNNMAGFKSSPLKTATFNAAGRLLRSLNKVVPADLQGLIADAGAKAKEVLSDDCYELLPICKEKGCIPIPTSLRPVDVKKVDPMGWHYLVGSNCGFKNWKRWKFWQFGQGCGPPLGITACTGSENSSTMPPTEATHAAPSYPPSGEVPDEDTQNDYAALVLNLINIASEIHAGRANQLVESIASSLPEYLTSMSGFKDSPLKTATFAAAGQLLKTSNKAVPADLQAQVAAAGAKAKQVLSTDCYDLLTVCKEKGCIPIPTSLRPVDVSKVNPMGWQYLVGSNCGAKNWKRWKLWQIGQGCGPPMAVRACEGSESSSTMPPNVTVADTQRLPEGAVFAAASVEPDTTIEVMQPGYALIATAEVVSLKRVNPGDRLDARTTSSIHFDDGTGLLINKLTKAGAPIVATVGLVSLLTHDSPQPLPVNNGSATMYVGSDQPFANAAIAVNNQNKLPDVTYAATLNPKGERIGQLSTFKNLQLKPGNAIAIRKLDSNGEMLQEAKVNGGVLDGTPKVSFNKPSYKPGEKGQLRIENQDNYKKLMDATCFGGAAKLTSEPIRIVPLSDVKGLPPQAPFGTTSLPFEAVHPGEARVAVIMPGAVPPKPVPNPGNDEGLKHANAVFERWQSQFGK